jgi:hypothetical protein
MTIGVTLTRVYYRQGVTITIGVTLTRVYYRQGVTMTIGVTLTRVYSYTGKHIYIFYFSLSSPTASHLPTYHNS